MVPEAEEIVTCPRGILEVPRSPGKVIFPADPPFRVRSLLLGVVPVITPVKVIGAPVVLIPLVVLIILALCKAHGPVIVIGPPEVVRSPYKSRPVPKYPIAPLVTTEPFCIIFTAEEIFNPPREDVVVPTSPANVTFPIEPAFNVRTFLPDILPRTVLLKVIGAPVEETPALVVSILTGNAAFVNVHGPPITTGPRT